MRKHHIGFVGVAFLASLFIPSLVHCQGYGSLDDDDIIPPNVNVGNPQYPTNQQVSALPQYDSVEQPVIPPSRGTGVGAAGRNPGAGRSQNNLWWQGQNAFQRPPGHPGVEQLAPNTNAYGGGSPAAPPLPNQPSRPFNNPAPAVPATLPGAQPPYNAPSVNPSSTGFVPEPQEPYEEPYVQPAPPYTGPSPQIPINNPVPPAPGYTGSAPSYNSPAPPYTSPVNNAVPPNPPYNVPANQQGFGWNAPPKAYQPQPKPGFGQPEDIVPGCDLINKEDCHRGPKPNIPPVGPPAIPEVNSPFVPPSDSQSSQSYINPVQPQPNSPYDPQPAPPAPQQPRQPYVPPQKPRPRPQPQPQQPKPNLPQVYNPADNVPYPGCPAAMLCVQDEYCNMKGIIEDNPLQLSAADRLYRVALVQCSEPTSGIIGVCCRDPNYVDPWPNMQGGSGMKKNHHGHHQAKGQNGGSPHENSNYGWNQNKVPCTNG